jgi:hypothetical protein
MLLSSLSLLLSSGKAIEKVERHVPPELVRRRKVRGQEEGTVS